MPAKREYEEYRNYRKEIQELELYLTELKNGNSISVTQKTDGIGGSKNSISDPTYMQVSYNEREEGKTLKKIAILERRISLLDEAVDSLESSTQKTAMRMHYLRSKSYTTTSCFMGIDRHQLFIILQRGLKNTQQYLDNANYWNSK